MQQRFAERKPYLFSFLLILLFFVINAVGVVISLQMDMPSGTLAVYVQIILALALVVIVTALGWWREIGFRGPSSTTALVLFLPALILPLGNLTFGIAAMSIPRILVYGLLALLSGFTEEIAFRGLMLRAFLPRGMKTAVLVSALFFGFTHALNALGGISSPAYVAVQIGYALAIGFCFAAMVVRGKMLWPLIIAHALGNFVAFLNSDAIGGDAVTTQLIIVSLVYILVFGAYGWYLLKREY